MVVDLKINWLSSVCIIGRSNDNCSIYCYIDWLQISAERIVTVRWELDQLEDNTECIDKFDVGVVNNK